MHCNKVLEIDMFKYDWTTNCNTNHPNVIWYGIRHLRQPPHRWQRKAWPINLLKNGKPSASRPLNFMLCRNFLWWLKYLYFVLLSEIPRLYYQFCGTNSRLSNVLLGNAIQLYMYVPACSGTALWRSHNYNMDNSLTLRIDFHIHGKMVFN